MCQSSLEKQYRHLPAKDASDEMEPWHTVHIDLIGPYDVKAKQNLPDNKIRDIDMKLVAMTMIDPTTGWFEIAEVPYEDIGSARLSLIFNKTWLARYPRPKKVVYDNATNLKKHFVELILDYGIKPALITVKNPQANAMVERVHQVVVNMLRVKKLTNHIFDYLDPWGEIFASVAWAIRSSYHSTKEATPAQLVFNRDMVMNIAHIANWKSMAEKRQLQINRDNARENSKRVRHDYVIGDRAYIVRDGVYRKLKSPNIGPYRVTLIYSNGTVRLQRGAVNERVNIRRLTPHYP